ncbi:MAG: type II toxin-antitoxin system VapC family toxin [Candidatus Doudnabacteria bacterium]|nr:type II toxin-antitoxin system VapC family toxin [Candidatus Doudnabacteria bacterium]
MPTDAVIKASRLVIDASVAVKWFSEEKETPVVHKLFHRIYRAQVGAYAPDLLVYEVGNALFKGKNFDQERVMVSLNDLLDSGIEFTRMDRTLIKAAIAFMADYNLTFYDAAYLGLGHIFKVPVLTADLKYYRRVKEVNVIDLRTLKS